MKKGVLPLSRAIGIVLMVVLMGAMGNEVLGQGSPTRGVGAFSVSASQQVFFSPGNLQYQASTDTWRFAEHQWDYVGSSNSSASSTYSGWIDLFGWGTSGYNHGANCYQPWSTSTNYGDYLAYGNYTYNLYDQTGQADWGYNAISNGGNTENSGWRTLTQAEWDYVFNTRSTSSGIRYAKAKVNNINGVILLPDDWQSSYYSLNSTNSTGASFSTNTITATQWSTLEQHGAVFLPAAGSRYGASVSNVGSNGYYWSSSYLSSISARLVYFYDSYLNAGDYYNRYYGLSVRLVRSLQNYSVSVTATPNPALGGAVSGGGACQWGADCTLTATANAGYTFINWIENGVIVSTEPSYTFVAWFDGNYVANFVTEGSIEFADANVKAICVENWDTNDDGELSYVEAANVTDLGVAFKNNTSIHAFNELQYFVSLGSIGEQAFYGCTELTQVTIPEPVTSVGSKAFWNCPSLQTVYYNAINCSSMQTTYSSNTYSVFSSDASGSAPAITRVVIGSNVQRIPAYAFKGSEDIYQRLVIPASVVEIDNYAFYGCNSLVQMTIQGEGLQHIGDYAFSDCSALRSNLVLPNSVTAVDQYAFYGCSVLPSLTIGEGMTTIEPFAFWNCPSLQTVYYNAIDCESMQTSYSSNTYAVFSSDGNGSASAITRVVVGSNVLRIPAYAFKNSQNINQPLVIPASVTEIDNYAFYGCNSLVQMTIQGEGLQRIGNYAFYGCSALRSDLVLPNSVTTVEQYAFYGCTVLPSLTIGEGVSTIGGYAFWNCPALTTVHFNATNCTSMVTSSQYSVFNSGTSNSGSTAIDTLFIGDNVMRIPDYAFRNSTNMTSIITIPDATTYIGTCAFYGSHSPELTIGEGVTTIGGYAFWNCPSMATVHFNATNCTSMVTNSEYSVFNSGTSNNGATSIVSLSIGDNVTRIPDYAFRNSSNMTCDLVIPNSVISIGTYSFANSSHHSLVIGDNVTTIAPSAFRDCASSTGNLILPNSLTTLGEYAFYNCSGFNGTLTLSNALTVINQYTFYGCSSFHGVLSIPNSVISINNNAFQGCSSFTGALDLHDAITSIGDYAFYGCSSISELSIGEGMTSIGGYAFWHCPAMATVHFNAVNCTSMVTNGSYSVFNSGTSNGGATPIVTLSIGDKVTRIPDYAFRYSSNMTCNITLPSSVTSIGSYSFANCSGHNVFTGDNVTSIGDYAFLQSSGFNGTLLLGDALASIGQYAFQGCSGFIGDLIIPNAVTSLGQYAFQNCSGFNGSLILGSGVETINQYTFADCTGFSGSLIIGRVVNSIGQYAFKNCSAFTSLISENPTPPTAVNNSFQSMTFTIPVYVPYAMIPDYQSAAGWSQFTNYKEQCVFDQLDNDHWSDVNNWYAFELPTSTDVVCVNSNCQLDMDANVLHLYVLNLNDVLTINEGKTLATTYGVGALQPSQLVIADGGQMINPISNAYGTVQRVLAGFGTGDGGWYTLCSPIYGGSESSVLAIGNYDFYSYDETTHYWMNSESMYNNIGKLEIAHGYLYANQSDQTVSLSGQLIASNADISIPVTRTDHELPGLNLVGNPYTNNISINSVKINGTAVNAYYKAIGGIGMVAYTNADNDTIKPGEGFMVTASEGGTLSFTPTSRSEAQGAYIRLVLSRDGELCDRAYLSMKEEQPLGKLKTLEGQSLLYFQTENESYAVANKTETAQLRFEPAVSATYTIEASLLHAQCDYLHLIDHVTGNDIDLLETPSYTFEAVMEDPSSRFSLAFSPDEVEPESFEGRDLDSHFRMPYHSVVDNQNAYYKGYPFVITAVASPEDFGTVTGSGTYARGATCTLTATEYNSVFLNWTKDGKIVSDTSTYSFVVTDGGTYVANFNPFYEIIATADPEDWGTVTGSGIYQNDSICTLTAAADTSYWFYCWTKGDGLVVSNSATYSFTVTEEAEYIAHFTDDIEELEVTIGSGTSTNEALPSHSNWNYSLTQQIYTPAEIGAPCTIETVAFYNGGSTKTRSYDIYMVHTNKSAFTSNTDWISVASSDRVFSGSVTMTANQWTTITLNTPFVYDGTSNLALVVDDNTGSYSSGMSCRVFNADGNQAIRIYSDDTNYNPYSPSSYSGTLLNVKNQVVFGGVLGTVETYSISATVDPVAGGTVVGVGNYLPNTTASLTAVANAGYTFLNWANDGEVVSTDPTYSFAVAEDVSLVAHFIEGTGTNTQTTALTEGWNWYSSYIVQDGNDGLAQMENSLGDNGVTIKSRDNGFVTNFGSFWTGSLSSIDNQSTYLIQTNADCEMTVTGAMASPSAYPITLPSGWSWIGYPCGTAMSVSTALAGLSPVANDVLKAREGFATYTPGVGWIGTLQTITPGVGLMFNSHNSSAVTLTYPNPSKSETLLANITARDNHWVPAMQTYPDNMTMIAEVELDHATLESDQYELAVFVKDECRGSAKLMYVAALDRYMAFLTIYGEASADLRFALYDSMTGEEYYGSDDLMPYLSNSHVGTPESPYTVSFRAATALDELDSHVHVFPNPVEKGRTFSIGNARGDFGEVQVEFFNALGATVTKVTASSLPAALKAPEVAGVYTLKIISKGKECCYRKLVVQ